MALDEPPPAPRQSVSQGQPHASDGGMSGPGASDAHLAPHQVELLRQLRVLEDRYVNLRRKAQLTDENVLSQEQKLQKEVRSLTDELTEVRRTLADLGQGLQAVQSELQHAASIYDVKAIEKYLEFWEPVQFVTQAEMVRGRKLLKEPSGNQSGGTR